MIQPITIADLRGGRNGVDSPIDPTFPNNQGVEAYNVDFSLGPLGRRRGGADDFAPAGGTAFTSPINALSRWVPAGDQTASELHVVDGAAAPLVKRLSGTTYSDVTLDDAIQSSAQKITFSALGGKNFYAYDAGAGVDRLHVYDPDLAVPRVRRVGIAPGTNPPTVANTGAGAYGAVARYYRTRFVQIAGTRVIRRSEPTPASVVFTPSGGGTAARVTRPTAPGEGETHWELDASINNLTWYKLSSFAQGTHTAIATTTYDDSFAPSGYTTLLASDVLGFYTLPPSAKYVVSDNNRLLMAGHYANSLTTSRVWFTPVLGSSDQGDDERLYQTATQKPFIDFNEKDGGEITALSPAIGGVVLTFKYTRTIRLGPTGDANTPYLPREISHTIGCIEHDSVVVAEDAEGNPAVYWMSDRGPYRYGTGGLQYLGRDIEDYWRGLDGQSAVNLDATTKVCHGKYYSQLGQIWWWIATGASNTPNLKLILDIKQATKVDRFGIRGGWAVHTGPSATAMCSVMFGETLGAGYTRKLKPYIGLAGSANIYKCDTTSQGDNGTAFQAYVKTKSLVPSSTLRKFTGVGDATMTCKAVSGGTLRLVMDADFGLRTEVDDVSIAPEAQETHVTRTFRAAQTTDLGVVQMQIGDIDATLCDSWSIDAISVDVSVEGDK